MTKPNLKAAVKQPAIKQPAIKQSAQKPTAQKSSAPQSPAQKSSAPQSPAQKSSAPQSPAQKPYTPSGRRVALSPGTLLAPLPVALVTAGSPDAADVVTVAWTGVVCTRPPTVYISLRPERHSHKLIGETGEFVINLVTAALVRTCDWCGMYSGRDRDKFRDPPSPLTKIPSQKVAPPTIAESPLALECRVLSVTPLGSHDMFIASVEAISCDAALVDAAGKLRLDNAALCAFSHGEYFALGKKLGDFGFSVRRASKHK